LATNARTEESRQAIPLGGVQYFAPGAPFYKEFIRTIFIPLSFFRIFHLRMESLFNVLLSSTLQLIYRENWTTTGGGIEVWHQLT